MSDCLECARLSRTIADATDVATSVRTRGQAAEGTLIAARRERLFHDLDHMQDALPKRQRIIIPPAARAE
jgi:hypothetical protein